MSGARARAERAKHRAAARSRLDAIYAQVPAVACQGLCHRQCTVIDMSDEERRRIAKHGVTIPPLTPETTIAPCPALTVLNRCSVYEVRPLVCRLWGVAEGLPCEHGCEPERVLPDVAALALRDEAYAAGGDRHAFTARRRP